MIFNRISLGYQGFGFLVIIFMLSGCQTTSNIQSSEESTEDVQEVISVVAGALSGKQLSEDEVKDLEHQIRTDEDAQTAIQAITESMGGSATQVKYCPVSGERYAAHLELCPEHNVPLEIVSP